MADIAISKASYQGHILIEMEAYLCDRDTLAQKVILRRNDTVSALLSGKVVVTVIKAESNTWNIIDTLSYQKVLGSYFIRPIGNVGYGDYLGRLPKNLPRRKTFVSYYHADDQYYKERIDDLFDDLIINKSVDVGDINSDNSADYIKYLIQNQYLHDTTIIIVLVSEKTKHRKHIDWEISAALNYKVGDSYAGLIGLHLPHHIEYGSQVYIPSLQPQRLAVNTVSGYAKIYDWREDRVFMQNVIEDAFSGRTQRQHLRDNSLVQMQRNTN